MDRNERIKQYLQTVPKAELHIHLEGSIRPETLYTLVKRNKISLPNMDPENLPQMFLYRDFAHFVETFVAITGCLKTAEDYEFIAYELGAEMARQHIAYAEVTFSVSTHAFSLGIPFDIYFPALQRGRARAKADFHVEMRWIFDIVRAVPDDTVTRRADYTTKLAIECQQEGVVALGLGGSEVHGPAREFVRWFAQARAAGLHSVPHAGETVGPESVWDALRLLGAERIGHGVRSIEDPQLVQYLAQQHIPLEVCPCSNVCLGVYPDLATHPLPQLLAAGVPLSVNSDDPPLFSATLSDNITALHSALHLSLDVIDELLLNGVRHSFLAQSVKDQMELEFSQEMRRLREELDIA